MENQNKMSDDIYDDMEKKKQDTVADIKELHSRITTVDRNLSDKIELTERRIMEEIKSLRTDIAEHNQKEDNGVKIMDADGSMLDQAWEPLAEELANTKDLKAFLIELDETEKKNRYGFMETIFMPDSMA